MKKLVILILGIILATAAFSQTQKGYVKTKGRLDNDGNLIPGTPVAEVIIKVKNRNEVMSDKKGNFSFPMPDNIYYLENVSKNGYVLTDPDVLLKQYNYSANKLVISLETKEQQIEERMENFAKINAAQSEMIRNLRNEVKRLKEENKITEEEYSKRLQEISDMQVESQKLVEDMVDRYSKIDYDQLNEFDRQISVYILNGELHKADSLLNTKGNLGERAENLKKLNEANAKEREEITKRSKKLEKSEALALKERDDLASDYYHKFEILKMQHKNDSAAYYLELRAALDTTNVEWLDDAGCFIEDYIADYDKAMELFQAKLRQSILQYGDTSADVAYSYANIGNIYVDINKYDKALECYYKSIAIKKQLFGENHMDVTVGYFDVALVFSRVNKYEQSLDYYTKALNIRIALYGENDNSVANCYLNMAGIYYAQGDFVKALDYYNEGLRIKELTSDNKVSFATTYNNLGVLYSRLGDKNKSIEYLEKALYIDTIVLGENHPNTAKTYNNIGILYRQQKSYAKALYYYELSLEINKNIFGENNSTIAINYYNIGFVYDELEEYDKAIEMYNKALEIFLTIYSENNSHIANCYEMLGEAYKFKKEYAKAKEYYDLSLEILMSTVGANHYSVGRLYNNMGNLYDIQKDYKKALEYYNKALEITKQAYGESHQNTKSIEFNISGVQKELQESQKK